jgi:uncharacterized membrane protein
MLYFFFGLISALSFGVSNAYWKIAARQIDFPYLVLFRGIIASFFFGFIWLMMVYFNYQFTGAINPDATIKAYLGTIALCMVCSLGLVFFLKSMEYSKVSITVALSSVNIVFILTTVFIVGERFNLVYLFSFILSITGILLSQSFDFKKFSLQWNKGANYALLASSFWGFTYPLFKFASPAVGALPLSFILESSVTGTACLWILLKQKNQKSTTLISSSSVKHYLILASLLIGGTMFFNLAIQQVSVLNLNILSNLQFAVAVLLGIILYREKVSLNQFLGILLIFSAIILARYFSF